uniref:Uncharacterized protein n=1 Tax=Corethron hystrix TaxID=216773 RepID=A0A7S1BA06_9STRA|mmetsp:Transcript_18910/g.43091  ORF Transcript_18910/g.43091 Transcript_18910/m.43091 type:complete len:189 (+) Transcript_18910:235-801(+)|eukprot:CAMPEP_0113303848 /NCGR_PEP_ID=MMETSP0010_2-20120614/4089_1 /TAXON_ID=216773 ORGANISM="Corethron hystrix, Strain 308" /NCGR_SAMPLE_ID=MMETSP0010_2 /ASSEMBLY_ACC=CAM_ASM_000155 /LENGTH=188 /DNA_ID=CAMNT_0000157905 /DNA_START=125 /DNA_END=691 /DNA_ORIENTATION=+ /assembly_acc=CAM_ASM_000155
MIFVTMFKTNFSKLVPLFSQRASVASSLTAATYLCRPITSEVESSPSIADRIINITFVDHTGARATVPARWGSGRTLYDAASDAGVDLGPQPSVGLPTHIQRSDTWREPVFGEGPGSGIDHVLLPGKWFHLVEAEGCPRTEVELDCLQAYWDDEDITESSRLSSQIILNGSMDGMNVFVPDGVTYDCP